MPSDDGTENGDDGNIPNGDAGNDGANSGTNPNAPQTPTSMPAPRTPSWSGPKRAMTRFAGGNGTPGGVTRSYVRSSGGARAAATSAISGVSTTARLGGFLSTGIQRGFVEAARQLGLQNWVGRSAQFVLASFIELLAPDGALLEEAAARKALIETMTELFDRSNVEEGGLEALNAITEEGLQATIALSVTNYVNERIQQDLVNRIERGTLSESNANTLIAQMHDFIRSIVKIDFKEINLLALDWNGAGRQMVERVYQTAYLILEGAA